MRIELFYSDGCGGCTASRRVLKEAVLEAFPAEADWRDLEILEHIDRAVELGVLSVPAVAVDGELVFAKLPTVQQLVAALTARAAGS